MGDGSAVANNRYAIFRPHAIISDVQGGARRTFLPEDLKEEDAEPLRRLAEAVTNPFVKARIAEALWDRFEKYPDAAMAIESRFAIPGCYGGHNQWPVVVRNLGRLTFLVVRVNAKNRLPALVSQLDDAAESLADSERPFALPVLADMICHTFLMKRHRREEFCNLTKVNWVALLEGVTLRFRSDGHHGHDALVVLRAWHLRSGAESEANAVAVRIVEQLIAVAQQSDAAIAPSHMEHALQHALEFGIPDLVEQCRVALSRSIRAAIPGFREHAESFNVPAEILAEIETLIAQSKSPAVAIRILSVQPGLLELNLDALRRKAREQLSQRPFLALVPTRQFHPEGRISFASDDSNGNLDHWTATLCRFRMVMIEAVLQHFLAKTLANFDERTLVAALAEWPYLGAERRLLLEVAAERFSNRDWVSSGYIVTTVYEAVLRDLLRANGHSALKIEPGGVQMDETLNSLIHGEPSRAALGRPHCDLVDYVLCNPSLGWNLRNEIAHGTVRAAAFSPARVLLVWLILIRVTTLVPICGRASKP